MDIENKKQKRSTRETGQTGAKKFRSKLEKSVATSLSNSGVKYLYEPKDFEISYLVPAIPRKYLPDFILTGESNGRVIYVEVKGRWDYEDRYKHLLIKQQHPDLDIRFVFQRVDNRIRKGSSTTYRDICEGRGKGVWKGIEWKYADGGKVPKEWLKELE